jgi:hypothetical protein
VPAVETKCVGEPVADVDLADELAVVADEPEGRHWNHAVGKVPVVRVLVDRPDGRGEILARPGPSSA